MEINWKDPNAKISKYFTVKEAIWLERWNRLAEDVDGLTPEVCDNIVKFFTETVDEIREILGDAMFSKSCFRSDAYNKLIGGARLSCHRFLNGDCAFDFWTDADGDGDKDGKDCDDIKAALRPHLERLKIRMEDNGKGAKWVHVDNKKVPPGGNREFLP